MPDRSDITYFGAGPALLPTTVLETAAKSLVNYNDTGLGLAEHSHRSELATKIVEEAKADLASYLDIPDDYEVLFMQGGGSGEFSATVYNLVNVWVERRRQRILQEAGIGAGKEISEDVILTELRKAVEQDLKIDYLVTGSWSLKASQEAARLVGPEYVNIVADGRKTNDGKFGKIPDEKDWKLSKNAAMVYYCDNETVDGVEFPSFPKALEPVGEDGPIVVADMSSNILSRRIPIKNFSLIFFGAQKNLGSTGITVVIIKKSLLPPAVGTPAPSLMRKLGLPVGPIVLSYETIAKNKSLYNTLSIFDVYIAGQVLKKALATFADKVDGQQILAEKKSKLIYAALDAHPESYKVVPDKSSRSRMNICFRVTHGDSIDAAEKLFLKQATEKGLTGLKGHRSKSSQIPFKELIASSQYPKAMALQTKSRDEVNAWLHAFHHAADSLTTTTLPKFYTEDATLNFANNEPLVGLSNIIYVSTLLYSFIHSDLKHIFTRVHKQFFNVAFPQLESMKHDVIDFDVVKDKIYMSCTITYVVKNDPKQEKFRIPAFGVFHLVPVSEQLGQKGEALLRRFDVYLDAQSVWGRMGEVTASRA
ncbi:Phosphoserine aminotransferase [Hyphodiscus hymeniophilus]|uniref:phosphoserine transaminase n=1 Tax=Hyphodiscus hymeniophilus TaxID=353542 RepID=A0A9P6VIJ0_9HELO|nr:Phosphoserine aminotransferase [Hyphodiscus hymeniophilus]